MSLSDVPERRAELLNELVMQCTIDLFQVGGVEVRAVAERQHSMEYAVVVGFSGDKLRGVIGLGMASGALGELATRHAGTGDAVVGQDWLGETGNQLLGRIRNRLLGYGVVVSIALPTVLRGVELRLLATNVPGLSTYVFASDVGDVCVWLDVSWEQGFALPTSDDPALRGTPEGFVDLF